jgi:hypothetical protein
MSVQLILYPQSYEGVFNAFSGNPSQAIVNGISFTDLDNTTTYTSTSATPYVDTITNAPPSTVNTWYRYRVGSSAFPTVVSSNLVLNSLGNGSSEPTGVYQKISNLTIGQQYTVTINISTQAPDGFIANRFFDGITPQGGITTFSTATPTITKNFFASNTEMTYMLAYYSTSAENLTISTISVLPIGSTIADPILSDGQVILDLYEDEDLPLTLSVDNFKNVAEKVQSYSKAFNLPATKRNNKIFDQIFEITRSDDGVIFSPYKKSECVLKQDGFTLFKGYLRLLDVTDKDGEISYNVNLYSEVIALADYLKELSFRDLDFTELSHDYNKTQIKYSWNDSGTGITYTNPNTSGFRNAYSTVKYPFVNWNNQMLIANNPSGGSGPTDNNPQLVNLEQAFRPFINIKYIIERIFENTPFTFTSNFFDTTDFEKLYMDFNWGNVGTGVIDGYIHASGADESVSYGNTATTIENDTTTDGVNPDGTDIDASNFYSVSTNTFTSLSDNTWVKATSILKVLSMSSNFQSVQVSIWKNGNQMSSSSQIFSVGNTFTNPFFGYFLNTGDTLEVKIKTGTGITLNLDSESSIKFYIKSYNINTTLSLLALRGELGQWDFLKGLITMFNLVTIPDENNPNNIKIEPYVDVFINNTAGTTLSDRTIKHDWTDKIDVSEMKLEPLTDLNRRTIFKFVEDDDDFAFTNYKNQVGGHLYGSKKYNAGNEFNILEGLDEIVAEPFAATVIKPLFDNLPQFITPALYSYNADDDTSEGFDNSPRIMFDNGIKSTGASYYIPPQNGLSSENQSQFLQFSHLSDVPTITTIPPATTDTRDFHFGECQLLTGVGEPTVYNLFNLYWLPYYNELYNPNTRTMTIKVNLNPADINTFKFNDTVMIKNRVFRVNKIDYKPNDLATVEFILIP